MKILSKTVVDYILQKEVMSENLFLFKYFYTLFVKAT